MKLYRLLPDNFDDKRDPEEKEFEAAFCYGGYLSFYRHGYI